MTSFAKGGTLCLLIYLFLPVPQTFAASDSAFETLKSLQGKWSIQSDGKTLPIEMSYESGSNGSIVTEQFGKELSVFYPDGDNVDMIHFCNAGNQPRLRLEKTSRPGLLQFEMVGITNLKSADENHVQRILYKVVDRNRVELEIVWKDGKSETSEKYSLIRISRS